MNALHRAGFVHGDLKATNLFVADDGVSFVDLDATRAIAWAWLRARRQSRERARLLANFTGEAQAAWAASLERVVARTDATA